MCPNKTLLYDGGGATVAAGGVSILGSLIRGAGTSVETLLLQGITMKVSFSSFPATSMANNFPSICKKREMTECCCYGDILHFSKYSPWSCQYTLFVLSWQPWWQTAPSEPSSWWTSTPLTLTTEQLCSWDHVLEIHKLAITLLILSMQEVVLVIMGLTSAIVLDGPRSCGGIIIQLVHTIVASNFASMGSEIVGI